MVHEALAGAARAKLDRIEVFLDKRDESLHVVQLASLGVIRMVRLVAHGAHHHVEPLVARELAPPFDEVVEFS